MLNPARSDDDDSVADVNVSGTVTSTTEVEPGSRLGEAAVEIPTKCGSDMTMIYYDTVY